MSDEQTKQTKPYSVTDLGDEQTPDPLGDASLSAQERATAGTDSQTPDDTHDDAA